MGDYEHLRHVFEPVYDENSKVLILGTFPSVKSRENQFFYGHPQNRFWKLMMKLVEEARGEKFPDELQTIEEKKAFLLGNHIAIWDVIAECDIVGSSDSSIKNVIPADLSRILSKAPIQQIFANGNKAYELYQKYTRQKTGLDCTRLPSTSPANASYRMEHLQEAWKRVGEILKADKPY